MKYLNCKSQSGFTLIEILVVLCVIAIVTGFMIYRFQFNTWNETKTLASNFSHKLRVAEGQAILMSETIGVRVYKRHLQFVSYIEDNDPANASVWMPKDTSNFSDEVLPEKVNWSLYLGNELISLNEKEIKEPQIVISRNGELTPFALWISMQGKKQRLIITGTADGDIKTQFTDG